MVPVLVVWVTEWGSRICHCMAKVFPVECFCEKGSRGLGYFQLILEEIKGLFIIEN